MELLDPAIVHQGLFVVHRGLLVRSVLLFLVLDLFLLLGLRLVGDPRAAFRAALGIAAAEVLAALGAAVKAPPDDERSAHHHEADERGDYPDTKAGGSDISRIVRVENAGAQPEYVRARLRMTSVAPDGSSADASGNVAFHVNAGEGSPWIDGGDGWYYYRGLAGRGGVLDSGAMTESLMDSLRFVGDYHDAARGGSYRLDIDVQAVQAKNQQANDTVLDVLDVVGWPEAN